MTDEPAAENEAPLDPAEVKRAIKAFKKRLKLTRLNDESKLGRNPLTSGKKSDVVAIMPPHQYPVAIWQELIRRGRLKDAGNGFYELVE